MSTGSRLFGLGGFGSALKVRIYDFAVYIHPEQVSGSFQCQAACAALVFGKHNSECCGK